jgi:acetyl esterase/lipase
MVLSLPSFPLCAKRVGCGVGFDFGVADTAEQPRKGVNMPNNAHEFTTEDVEYLRHGDTRLIARLYKPKGDGPFPAVIDLHGGAWTSGDLTGTQGLDETLLPR